MPRFVHQEFRDAALGAKCADQIWDLTCAYLGQHGFDGAFLADQSGGTIHIRSNIDSAWVRDARDKGLTHADPFFAHCFASYDMLCTGRDHLHLYPNLTAAEVAFINAASEAGLRAGVSVPVRLACDGGIAGWHLLSSHGADAVRAVWGDDLSQLRISLLTVHHRLAARRDTAPRSLSTRERDCLMLCAQGARNIVIADKLCISESTVEFHLRNARRKLGARTREHAVAIALRKGLVG